MAKKLAGIFLASAAIAAAQSISTFAGNGAAGFAGDGGPATQAQINRVVGLASDSQGNLYLAEELNHRVRKVTPAGVISTFAGTGTVGFSGDGGPAAQAQLNAPLGVCVDQQDNVYINDYNNNRIRRVSNGAITTVFGNGTAVHSGDGGPATSAGAVIPIRCATDRSGALYFVDQGAHRVRKVSQGIVTTVAGTGAQGFSGDGGPATAATLNNPTAIAVDSGNNVYFTDQFNHRIRRIDGSGNIATVVFNGNNAYNGDGGPATSASASFPGSLAFNPAGELFIVDSTANRVRKVSGGIITTVAGNGAAAFAGDGGPATDASLSAPFAIGIDPSGNLYIGDIGNNRIRKVTMFSGAAAPVITSAGVTNSASFATGISPGAIITIFGAGLGAQPGQIIAAQGAVWPTTLTGGIRVTMQGTAVPVYRALNLNGQEQLSVLAPLSLVVDNNPIPVVVSTPAGSTAAVNVPILGAQPGIFPQAAGRGAVTHADGSLVSQGAPAARNETIIIYVTGLGAVSNAPGNGETASLTTLSPTVLKPQVIIGGTNASVAFAGLSPGYVGLYQINAVVPSGASGAVDLIVAANSQANPFLFTRSNTVTLDVQ